MLNSRSENAVFIISLSSLFLARFTFARHYKLAKNYNLVKGHNNRAAHKGRIYTGAGLVLSFILL